MPRIMSPFTPPLIDWADIRSDAAARHTAHEVELVGWMIPPDFSALASDYFLLNAEEPCCGGCLPRDPFRSVEVFANTPVDTANALTAMTLRGRLVRLRDDPAGWRYRLENAEIVESMAKNLPNAQNDAPARFTRRAFLASGAALSLSACAPGRFANYTGDAGSSEKSAASATATETPWRACADALTIDMHSHAGRVIVSRDPAVGPNRPIQPLSAPMRAGGMNVICLAIVTDTLVTHPTADHKRMEAWRAPEPGELYRLSQEEFARANTIVAHEQMSVVTSARDLEASPAPGPRVIIASEGADFLEGRLERVDEAYLQHRLRHLQLTHYRVNELGDIQTEPPVHGGLTDFGADVVRRCNTLGIVVDVAHGTFDLVKRAAAVTTRPLVLSHTALATHPSARSRLITPDHARAVAETGGVIGVWPNSSNFHDLTAMAHGFRRMADIVGVEHVGLGTDMLGFLSPPVFRSYEQLPALGNALLAAGFTQAETEQLLGGNYRRVFIASMTR